MCIRDRDDPGARGGDDGKKPAPSPDKTRQSRVNEGRAPVGRVGGRVRVPVRAVGGKCGADDDVVAADARVVSCRVGAESHVITKVVTMSIGR